MINERELTSLIGGERDTRGSNHGRPVPRSVGRPRGGVRASASGETRWTRGIVKGCLVSIGYATVFKNNWSQTLLPLQIQTCAARYVKDRIFAREVQRARRLKSYAVTLHRLASVPEARAVVVSILTSCTHLHLCIREGT